ncbi:hypothetical protein BJF79_26775 [Actinomadura sp. CNU-125]|uniref:helix-turn-helix domain-containing protein n=1 Tax=Actinomadura sp. CNU-125 TaxID=1904961 RepID=UPI0009607FD3|nr:hypothetical protein BJF79_26775 [Actinomadura sp. CNU-125]
MASSQSNDLTTYQEVFVAELRVRRENAGLSRNKLAQALGCSPQWISKIETFEKPPSEGLAEDLDTFFAASGLFGVSGACTLKHVRMG